MRATREQRGHKPQAQNERTQGARAPSPPEVRQGAQNLGRLSQLQQSIGNQGVQRMLRPKSDPLLVSGGPQRPQEISTQTQPTQTPGQTATGHPQPFTAVFNIAMHGPRAHAVCNIPETPGCFVKWSKWRLIDANGRPVMDKVTVSEHFTKISGPDDIFKRLKEQSNIAENGFFDDCYGICVPPDTPPFVLEVEQNHIVNGRVISKNLVTYSSSGISLRVCQRSARGFGPPCRRF
jgi:hypothetical protein